MEMRVALPPRVPGSIEGSDLKGCAQQLKYSLQLLALPVSGQVRLGDDSCDKMETVLQAFNELHQTACAALRQQLTPEQAILLAQIESSFLWLRQDAGRSTWSDTTIRRSAEWRRIRYLARKTLVAFGWALDLPPADAMIYQLVGNSGEQ
jgi:hypothetical protein